MRNPDDTIYKKTTFEKAAGVSPDWSPALEEIHKEVYRI